MPADTLLPPSLGQAPTVDTKRRLAEALLPGNRRLVLSGLLSTAAVAATAAGFFAVASVAQDLLDHHASWRHAAAPLLLLAVAAAARAVFSYLAAHLAVDGALAIERRLRDRLLDGLLDRGGPPLSSAAKATAAIDEVERVGAYAERYQPARVAAGLVPVLLLAVAFPLSWPVGVLLVLCAPLPPLNLSIVGMGTAAVARRHAEELRHLSGYFLDRLRGLETLRALGAERAELTRVRAASERLSDRAMAVLRVAFVSAGVLEAIVTLSVAVVAIYIGLTLLDYVDVPGLPAHMSLETGLFLLMITPLYFQPVRWLAAAYHERAAALAAIDALTPLLESSADLRFAAPGRSLWAPPAVELAGLSVEFPGRESPALADVSLSVAAGELVGIAGASGAGKSTLLRVLAGDLEASSGTALIDGTPTAAVERTAITWLGERPYLFEGTLADNIALGCPDASEPEIERAALAAGLLGALDRLADGLSTPIGEQGWGLSGGEAHRVALARTFLAGAPLLLLDEPTAHLDAASEAQIVELIAGLSRSATTIIASHSQALLARCDRVITLDRGRLLEASRVGAWEHALA